jgi:acyl-CoA oxidase
MLSHPNDTDASQPLETQVIRYPAVYMRIIPALCRGIVFLMVGKDMGELYDEMSSNLAEGDTSLLAETHAVRLGFVKFIALLKLNHRFQVG